MPNHVRRLLVALVSISVGGCVVASKPYEKPVDILLQDPPPGKAILYFLRAPYDSAEVAISVENKRLAALPSSTYTVVVLPPGRHTLVTTVRFVIGDSAKVSPDFQLELNPNERRFFNLSGVTQKEPALIGAIGRIPLFTAGQGTASGTRSWKEVTELDAQGLMSISKLQLPDEGAL